MKKKEFYSPHFTYTEMTASRTATKMGLLNEPDEAQIDNLQALCRYVLEPLRSRWREPIIVTSGFRCPKVNKAVGGVPNSQHLQGQAADIRAVNPNDNMKLGGYLEHSLIPFDQLIYEGVSKDGKRCGWLHVSWSEKPRKQVLRK